MAYADAREIVMCEVSCQGLPALFSELRLDWATVPDRYFVYEVRHADADVLRPVSVEEHVSANFRGTLITQRPLCLGRKGCYDLKQPFDFKKASITTLEGFCARSRINEKARDCHER